LSCSIVADVLVWIRLQDKVDITAERNVHWTANGDSKFEIVGKTLKINGLIASEDAGVYECSNNQESDKTNLIVYVSPTEVFMGSEYVDEEVIITCRTNVRVESDVEMKMKKKNGAKTILLDTYFNVTNMEGKIVFKLNARDINSNDEFYCEVGIPGTTALGNTSLKFLPPNILGSKLQAHTWLGKKSIPTIKFQNQSNAYREGFVRMTVNKSGNDLNKTVRFEVEYSSCIHPAPQFRWFIRHQNDAEPKEAVNIGRNDRFELSTKKNSDTTVYCLIYNFIGEVMISYNLPGGQTTAPEVQAEALESRAVSNVRSTKSTTFLLSVCGGVLLVVVVILFAGYFIKKRRNEPSGHERADSLFEFVPHH